MEIRKRNGKSVPFQQEKRNRQTTPRIDMHEIIVAERCETFRYCHIGGMGMTSAELKHQTKLRSGQHKI